GVIRDLWIVLEDARVEFRLRHEYPGLRRDLTVLAQEAVKTRSFLHGMTVREMIVDCLLRVSTAEPGTVRIPDSIGQMVEQVWARCQVILQPQATAEDALQLADQIYVLLDQLLAATGSQVESGAGREEQADVSPGPNASEQMSGVYRPITNWAYRGAMNPDLVELRDESPGQGRDSANAEFSREQTLASASDLDDHAGDATDRARDGLRREMPNREGDSKPSPVAPPDSLAKQLLTLGAERQGQQQSLRAAAGVFLYDEWDGSIQDYRTRWCRVLEQMAPEGSMQFADVTLENHGPAVRLLRRYFESIRPVGVRRVREQADGDELDLDAAVRRTTDRAAGAEPSDRLYIRREKRERDVAVTFLVDLSGSTSRQIDANGRRVIDVEREGLVLLCEALESVGDQYAIYGYSGQGRQQVDFVVLKAFEERSLTRTAQRIGAMAPLQQNRDGAAIRHAARKLAAQAARVKLLVLISDGKPLDDGYADEYSLEDTKMALREARMRSIEPFCITVDRDADDYLRRMYGDVRFLVIDQAASLPERLPRIYQRLTA
ncbi:MAG: nitric oxide reductase activation protein NorD, partial [Nitrospiraceae bacterium]